MRPLHAHETRTVWDGLAAWGDGVPDEVIRDAILWLDGDVVRLASPDLDGLPAELRAEGEGGLAIGVLQGEDFLLGLQGAVLAAPAATRGTVKVNEQATRLFLYRRKVLGESVLWHDRRLGPGDACIVLGPRGEALGLGRVVGTFKGSGEVVVPVHDLGSYLRDQDA